MNLKLFSIQYLGRNNCCQFVNVSSKGSGSTEYPQMMGKYEKFFTDRYGVSTYKRNTFILFKYYAGSTHTTWLVSTSRMISFNTSNHRRICYDQLILNRNELEDNACNSR